MNSQRLAICLPLMILILQLFVSAAVPKPGEQAHPFTSSLTKQRTSSLFYNSVYVEKLTATRFLPVFNLPGTGEWTSPRSVLLIDGIPSDISLLNLRSLDLIPLDVLALEETGIDYHPGAGMYLPTSGGALSMKLSGIPDTLTVRARLFTGSETGDPLIYIFSRPDFPHTNKNKIGPSFALAVSNGNGKWRHRVSGGGFFYFSTGSVNDRFFRTYDSELMNRQNRQIKFALDGSYSPDRNNTFSYAAAGLNLFSWEMAPFTSTFQHYTQMVSTFRFGYTGSASGLSVNLVREESHTWMKESYRTDGGALSMTGYGGYASLRAFSMRGLSFTVNLSINHSVADRLPEKEGPGYQALLLRKVEGWQWGIGGIFSQENASSFTYRAGIRIDGHYAYSARVSGEGVVEFEISDPVRISIFTSSAVYFPLPLERYGSFITARTTSNTAQVEEFRIQGNPGLTTERTESAGMRISLESSDRKYTGMFDGFIRSTRDPVAQMPGRIVRSSHPGDIVREARYENLPDRMITGFAGAAGLSPFSFFTLNAEFQYLDNSDAPYLPRTKATLQTLCRLPLNIYLDVTLAFSGRAFFSDFFVSPENDYDTGFGVDGVIPASAVVDFSIARTFEGFYFMKEFEIRAEAQNIFNEPVRYLPIGNYIDRAVFIYASFRI